MKGNALLHLVKYLLGIEAAHSQTTQKEKDAIRKYAKGASVAVEIGVYEGVNTINIANSIDHKGKLYGIDPFFKGKLGLNYGKIIAHSLMNKNQVISKVQLIEKLSNEAVNDVKEEIDFIFIDGDHSIEGIKIDWKDWSSKLKMGGIIALHDTSVPDHDPTVADLGSYKYFNSTIKDDQRFKILDTVDSLNILERIA